MLGLDVGSGFPWLGGRRDPGNHSNWVWSDGTPWDYSNWALGEPNDNAGEEDCVELGLRDMKNWNDEPCRTLRTIVSKKGKNPGQYVQCTSCM